jgi:hypothetical protein
MRRLGNLLITAALVAGATSASAATPYPTSLPATTVTIGFDEKGLATNAAVPDGYFGLDWDNFTVLDVSKVNPQEFASSPNVALDPDSASFSSAHPFRLDSIFVSNLSKIPFGKHDQGNPETVTILGFTDNVSTTPAFTWTSGTIGVGGHDIPLLNWNNVTKVVVESHGSQNGDKTSLGIDAIAVAAPEPSTYVAIFAAGLGIVFFAANRRRGMLGI